MVNQNRISKITYKIGNENKRVVSKIFKIHGKSQYRNAMTKPLPTGSIKKKKCSYHERI